MPYVILGNGAKGSASLGEVILPGKQGVSFSRDPLRFLKCQWDPGVRPEGKFVLLFLVSLLVAFLPGPFRILFHVQHFDEPSLSDEDVRFQPW